MTKLTWKDFSNCANKNDLKYLYDLLAKHFDVNAIYELSNRKNKDKALFLVLEKTYGKIEYLMIDDEQKVIKDKADVYTRSEFENDYFDSTLADLFHSWDFLFLTQCHSLAEGLGFISSYMIDGPYVLNKI